VGARLASERSCPVPERSGGRPPRRRLARSRPSRAGCGWAGDIRAGGWGRSIGLRAQDAEAQRAAARARSPTAEITGASPGQDGRAQPVAGHEARWQQEGEAAAQQGRGGRRRGWQGVQAGGPERRRRRTAQPAAARAPGRLERDGPPARGIPSRRRVLQIYWFLSVRMSVFKMRWTMIKFTIRYGLTASVWISSISNPRITATSTKSIVWFSWDIDVSMC